MKSRSRGPMDSRWPSPTGGRTPSAPSTSAFSSRLPTQNFLPSIVATLGFNKIDTLLLTVPPYVVCLITSVLNNWSADRTRNSTFHSMWPLVVSIIAGIISASTLGKGARYFAMILLMVGGHSANTVVAAWAQKTLLRPRIKRAAAIAFINACGNIAQVSLEADRRKFPA